MINSSKNFGGAAPFDHREGADSEITELEFISSSDLQQQIDLLANSVDPKLYLPVDNLQQQELPNSPSPIVSTDKQLDVKAELDSLLASLQVTTPHPLDGESTCESSSIANIFTNISTTNPVTHIQESIQELTTSREQLTIAKAQLQILAQFNQIQVDRVNESVIEVKQIKLRIQQLAQYSKNQINNAGEMLDALAQIRAEIVTSMDKFGGYEEIHSMLSQLEITRYALVIAHDCVTTGQEAFYDSLRTIQTQVAARSHESEAKLQEYQESIESLSQTISTDRLRIARMSVDMSTKLNELDGLSAQINTIYAQIVEKSQTIQSKITQIDRGFVELSAFIHAEKEQFYELTVESIEKADLIRLQLADIIKQISEDRLAISTIEAEVKSVQSRAKQEAERQLTKFELRDRELISLANNLDVDYNHQLTTIRKLFTWLWLLSIGMGILFMLSIRLSLALN